MLAGIGLPSSPLSDVDSLLTKLSGETLLLILAEEGLASGQQLLADHLQSQPAWSDLPILLLSAGGLRSGGAGRWRFFEQLGNLTILDRPLHVGTLQTAVRAALRDRRRQYQIRAQLEELQGGQDLLAQKVEERTRDLEYEVAERRQVEVALSRAQRLEAIGQLTGGVAHDFNNLLQVVTGGITLLQKHGADAERRNTVLEAMEHATQRGAKLTQQLLAFARRQSLAVEPVDVARLIDEMQILLRGSLRSDTALDIRVGPDLWPVNADPTQLEVAILNLVVNARDAMSRGGQIIISASNTTASADSPGDGLAGAYVRISVSDNGPGMSDEIAQRAFEPFFSTKPIGSGTGLGLSQVYGFSQQSGGVAQIDSSLGQGTTVSILLPRGQDAPEPAPQMSREPASHRGGRVLIVEDEDQVAQMAAELLEDLGYLCERAVDAEQALSLDLSAFSAVFSDVVMPGPLDGIELAQRLRRDHPDLPVLLATGFAGSPDRLALAGVPVLKKPYTLADLNEAFDRLLSAKGKTRIGRNNGL